MFYSLPLFSKEDTMTTELFVDATSASDLLWKKEKEKALEAQKSDLSIIWSIDLGISPSIASFTDEFLFRQRCLALQSFTEHLFPAFAQKTGAIVIASSDLYRSLDPIDFPDNYKELSQFSIELYAMTLFGEYIQGLIAFLPEDLPIIVRIDATSLKRRSDIAFLLCRETFRFVHLEVEGWYPQTGTLGCVVPPHTLYNEITAAQFETMLSWIEKHNIPFRLISETTLNEKWDGIDTLLFLGEATTTQGKRQAIGFQAAGGTVMSYGKKLGLSEEVLVS